MQTSKQHYTFIKSTGFFLIVILQSLYEVTYIRIEKLIFLYFSLSLIKGKLSLEFLLLGKVFFY